VRSDAGEAECGGVLGAGVVAGSVPPYPPVAQDSTRIEPSGLVGANLYKRHSAHDSHGYGVGVKVEP
jgi:hypothetical protein